MSTKELLNQKEDELNLLYRLDAIRDSSKTLAEFLERTLSLVIKVLGAEGGSVVVHNKLTDELELRFEQEKSVNEKSAISFSKKSSMIKGTHDLKQ